MCCCKKIAKKGVIVLKSNKTINWGISKELQADIRYEPNACKGYVMDLSLGCPHHCKYCLFSTLELKAYKLQNPNYTGGVINFKLDKFLKRTIFPPSVYLSYSSDPLGDDISKESTKVVLKKLFENNVNVLFITKGLFDDSLLNVIQLRPDLMNIQIDISSCNQGRNKVIESGAPTYEQRIGNILKLAKINGLPPVVVRMDPLLPDIDDTEENIEHVFKDITKVGIREVVVGYVILPKSFVKSWYNGSFTNKVAKLLTEETPTISGEKLYSIPFDKKLERINKIQKIGTKYGIKVSVCGCKDERFKKCDLEWICHPFNRSRRQELNKLVSNDMKMEFDHLI